jgi:hypothetical protein
MGTAIPLLSVWTFMAGYRVNFSLGGMILILCDNGIGCTAVYILTAGGGALEETLMVDTNNKYFI